MLSNGREGVRKIGEHFRTSGVGSVFAMVINSVRVTAQGMKKKDIVDSKVTHVSIERVIMLEILYQCYFDSAHIL